MRLSRINHRGALVLFIAYIESPPICAQCALVDLDVEQDWGALVSPLEKEVNQWESYTNQ